MLNSLVDNFRLRERFKLPQNRRRTSSKRNNILYESLLVERSN